MKRKIDQYVLKLQKKRLLDKVNVSKLERQSCLTPRGYIRTYSLALYMQHQTTRYLIVLNAFK